ncbi:MAG: endonuclease/exonuclease/phosphatase family protein, partial [Kofleriaceae bacterium]
MIKSRWPWSAAWLAVWILGACGSSANQAVDADVIDTRPIDAPAVDATPDPVPDAFVFDAAPDAAPDAHLFDAALPDAFVLDASSLPDAFVLDASPPPDATILDAAPDASPLPDAAVPPGNTRVRLVAGNISSGNAQAYELPGIRIFEGLAPDVAMIQEFNVTTGSIRGFVDQAFGTQFAFVRGASSQQIPNGVISRYPIVASGEWIDTQVGNRDFVWARIDIPGPIDLFAISVHLLTTSSAKRNLEAGELAGHIQELPADAYVVLGGDFNTDTR